MFYLNMFKYCFDHFVDNIFYDLKKVTHVSEQ